MNLSRRDLGFLFPVLVVARAAGANENEPLPGRVYHDRALPWADDPQNAQKKGREFFRGVEHSGFALEMHETMLQPGTATHAPHKHQQEEIIIIAAGSAETLIEGKTELAEAGSVVYMGSNQMHSIRNAGTTPCRYYVIELRGRAPGGPPIVGATAELVKQARA